IGLGLAGRRDDARRALLRMRRAHIPAFQSWTEYLMAWLGRSQRALLTMTPHATGTYSSVPVMDRVLDGMARTSQCRHAHQNLGVRWIENSRGPGSHPPGRTFLL